MTQDELEGRTIMIVDDDQALGEMLSIVLENEGFRTVTCLDGLRAVEMFPTVEPDLILLDVMLPGIDGTEVARRIRATSSNVPIIMLTAKSDTVDVVAGLEAGADDYVSKPFKVVELLARIRARFRIQPKAAGVVGSSAGARGLVPNGDAGPSGMAQGGNGDPNRIERGSIVIDRLAHTATRDDRDLSLTPMEFELLAVLAASAGDAISRSSLLKRVWGYESSGDTRLVNVHVQRLRAKVEDDPEHPSVIVTVRGIGYKFVPPEPRADA